VTLVLTVLFLGLLVPVDRGLTPAEAGTIITPACGAVIGPRGGPFTLGASVGPCAGPGPALTVVGPARLNMAGNMVFCAVVSTPPDGILVTGVNAHVTNGRVFNCRTGIVVAGTGGHRISAGAAGNLRDGIRLDSNDNKLVRSIADFNGDSGITVLSDGNDIFDSTSLFNAFMGFDIVGDHNKLWENTARQNSVDGIHVPGDSNQIFNNVSTGNSAFDLTDFNQDCDDNQWYNNTFVTRNQACVK
jgi:hypothetical protein